MKNYENRKRSVDDIAISNALNSKSHHRPPLFLLGLFPMMHSSDLFEQKNYALSSGQNSNALRFKERSRFISFIEASMDGK